MVTRALLEEGKIHKARCADRVAAGIPLSGWTFSEGGEIHLSSSVKNQYSKISSAQAVTEIFPDSAIAA